MNESLSDPPGGVAEALRRAVAAERFEELENLWIEAIDAPQAGREELAAFRDVARTLVARGEEERARMLLELLVPPPERLAAADRRALLDLHEMLLRLAPAKPEYRKAYTECFTALYGPATPERACFQTSGLAESGDVLAALERLKRLLEFRVGSVVYHPSGWGMGEIVAVDPFLKQVRVNLEQKRDHAIALEAVDSILEVLPPDSFRALLYRGGGALGELARERPEDLIEKVFSAFGNPLSLKELKAHLVPAVVPASGWSRWWSQVKAQLRASGYYRIEDRAPYRVEKLEAAVSYEEDLVARFEGGTWPERRQIARGVLRAGPKRFPQAFPRLAEALRQAVERPAEAVRDHETLEAAAFLLRAGGYEETARSALRRLSPVVTAAALDAMAEDPRPLLAELPEARPEDWRQVVATAFRARSDSLRAAALALLEQRDPSEAEALVEECCRVPHSSPEAFCWLVAEHLGGSPRSALVPLTARSARAITVLLLDLLAHLERRESRAGRTAYRERLRRIEGLLLHNKGRFFEEAVAEMEPEQRQGIHHQLVGLSTRNRGAFSRLIERLASLSPDLLRRVSLPGGEDSEIYTTLEGLRRKQEEFREITEVKLPAIFRAIGKAAEFGDLSENAEFTSALEERDHLTRRAQALRAELGKAQVIGPELLREGTVTIGSRVRVVDLDTDEELTYRVLGPWDGGPEEGVLSYRSPLGRVFLGERQGSEVEADLPRGRRRFRIVDIGSALQ